MRFPSPVPVGSRVRLVAKLLDVEDIKGGAQITVAATMELDGHDKPACVAEVVFRYLG